MIKGNRIEFGYGDVLVGFHAFGFRVENVKPPLEVGQKVTPSEFKNYDISNQIIIPLNGLEDLNELCGLIKSVTENNRIVEFNSYVFDFSNYNKKSVEVVLNVLNKPHPMWLMTLAC